MTGAGAWRRHVFHVKDAHFGNRQQSGADFRIGVDPPGRFHLDVVEVTHLPPG